MEWTLAWSFDISGEGYFFTTKSSVSGTLVDSCFVLDAGTCFSFAEFENGPRNVQLAGGDNNTMRVKRWKRCILLTRYGSGVGGGGVGLRF